MNGVESVLLIALLIWFVFIRQIKMAGKGALSFGKSKARLLAKEKNRTTFKDVAGIEEAVDFAPAQPVTSTRAPKRQRTESARRSMLGRYRPRRAEAELPISRMTPRPSGSGSPRPSRERPAWPI